MNKKRITYGVTGMMEYQAVIKMGRSKMKVTFTDGSATGYGMNPAMYTTDNLMVQKAIEGSEQFKSGRIHIVNSTDLEEEENVMRNLKEDPALTIAAKDAADSPSPAERDAAESSECDDAADSPETGPEKKPGTEMEFDNNDDAKDYLEQTFGCVRSKLRNRADIIAAGEVNGVSISFS